MSILPDSSSEWEHRLDTAIGERLAEIDIPLKTLWDPGHCPLEALPFLAWALSVDHWDDKWSEVTQRRVVANSLNLHRIKGTRPAIERALDDLGLHAELEEWWQCQPQKAPYTFHIRTWVNDNRPASGPLLTPDLYRALKVAVINAKNAESDFSFDVGVRTDGGVTLANASQGYACRHDMARATQAPGRMAGGLVAANGARPRTYLHISMTMERP
ncbi:phage tail protein I [Veronia pacifica]|uniref:Phage tail protein I n=1 Tax=Veronia pacifica TaxID=1080227 RepID=A0A1C3EBR0_9GAMM|nr:phage tail protein I [Veronia pacifica]ODA30624.1 phage tail protein I [Veronia pacifica]